MGVMGKIFKALGFESEEKSKRTEKNKTKASFKIKHGKVKSRAEEMLKAICKLGILLKFLKMATLA